MQRLNPFYILLFFSFCLAPLFLFGELLETESKTVTSSQPFFLVTIPKSGTHLMTKLLVMLSGRKPDALKPIVHQVPNINFTDFEEYVLRSWNKGSFPYQHSGNFAAPFTAFSELHPEFRKIVMIRDLRDLLVSLTYHHETELEKELGGVASFDEKLSHILCGKASRAKSIRKGIKAALALKQQQNFHVCRFEDFVGLKGGGSDQAQRREVTRLANYLGLTLDTTQVDKINENLFGKKKGPQVSGTFRKGQIGSWKNHFNAKHKALFRENWNELQEALGYPTL